jgi:GNAT superfamily N-acetyltransferase
VNIREARPGDGAAIATIHRENSAYYVGLAPDLFRPPDETGLADFMEPGADANTSTSLFIVAENDGEIVGCLYAELLYPDASARFQSNSDLSEVRLFIHAVGVAHGHQRRGIATGLVEAAEAWGRERDATLALCDTWIGSPVSIPFWERKMGYVRRSVRLRKPLP